LFVEWLAGQGHVETIAVAHGGSIRAIRAYCAGLTLQESAWDEVANGSVCCVQLPRPFSSTDLRPVQFEHGGIR
jgi:broad specificity phosphatase PhoE